MSCPVNITQRLLSLLSGDQDSSFPVVRRIVACKDHSYFHPSLGISYSTARDLFKEHITPFVGPVHMILGQVITPGQLTDPGVNFASVHGLMPITVHVSFSLPRGNFERRVTRCTTPGNPPSRGNFSSCEQNAKVAPGQKQSCACSLLMFGINLPMKSSRKNQK